VVVDTGVEPMSTAPIGPFVVMTTLEATVGVGVTVPEMVMSACPEYVCELVVMVIADAPKAAKGPRTRKAARTTVAIVLIVFIFDHPGD